MSTTISDSMSYTPPGSEVSTPETGSTAPDYLSSFDDALDDMLDELSGDVQVGDPVQGCPCQLPGIEADTLKTIHIDVGWTFSAGTPTGSYALSVAGQNFMGELSGGGIRIDKELFSLFGDGMLEIRLENGPVYRSEISLCLPPIQTEAGLLRRLTNLGWFAGEGNAFDQRAAWAVRAFKRVAMNSYQRGANVVEDENTDAGFLASLQAAYGAHPDDDVSSGASLVVNEGDFFDCQMFGTRELLRSSFEVAAVPDDLDPGEGAAVWAGQLTSGVVMPIAGPYRLFLRAFDTDSGDPVMPNRINLPQPVLMSKFVLWELGFTLVAGRAGWSKLNGTWTRLGQRPEGGFNRELQWAVREFQCYAKSPQAAREVSGGSERRYLYRLAEQSPFPLGGVSQFPEREIVSGSLCPLTRQAMQAWADQRLRCPVVLYASNQRVDDDGPVYLMNPVQRENLWFHEDSVVGGTNPLVFAVNWSGVYPIPASFDGEAHDGSHRFPLPITIGKYLASVPGGPKTIPQDNTQWLGESNEVTPFNLTGAGGLDGAGMSDAGLSTFKVVRTAAHFECSCFFDVINAYDTVGLSLGLCHWTLARVQGGTGPDEPRELPAFLACFQNLDSAGYMQAFGRYGVFPAGRWEELELQDDTRTYIERVDLECSNWRVNMSGVSGTDDQRRFNNTYCKTWHFYWRAIMASRTNLALRRAMWTMVRVRIRDILDGTFNINNEDVRVGDVATSEKAVALLLRWHIYKPLNLFGNGSELRPILQQVLIAHPVANQARETAMIDQIGAITYPLVDPEPPPAPQTWNDLVLLRAMANVPQQDNSGRGYVTQLNDSTLSDTLNSFEFLPP